MYQQNSKLRSEYLKKIIILDTNHLTSLSSFTLILDFLPFYFFFRKQKEFFEMFYLFIHLLNTIYLL